jgi:hypothetical protein
MINAFEDRPGSRSSHSLGRVCPFARRARVSLAYLSDCEVSDMLIAYSTYRCGLRYSGNSVAEAGR